MNPTVLLNTILVLLSLLFDVSAFNLHSRSSSKGAVMRSNSRHHELSMAVKNDQQARANRETRKAGADDRMVELKKPLGLVLDEDPEGNVFVTSIDANGRAEKSGKVFVGDQVMMVSATFGDDLWSCEGVGLTRVLSCIKVNHRVHHMYFTPLRIIFLHMIIIRSETPSLFSWY